MDLPIFFDIEEKRHSDLGKETLTKVIMAFCKAIENGGGLYANKNFFSNYIDAGQLEGKYILFG